MRLKIIAGNLAVVVLLGLASYLYVAGQLQAALLGKLEGKIGSDRELLERSFKLSALEFVDTVSARAAERQVRDVFNGLDVNSRRTRAFDVAESTAAWLADPARGERGRPDIVVVVDESGKALARNGARNVMFGQQLTAQIPALAQALRDGLPRHDSWSEPLEKKLLETAVAPIRDGATTLGALVVGYDLSNGMARREGDLLGRGVAFLVDGKVYSSSLEGGAARDLRAYLFGPNTQDTTAVLSGQTRAGQVWHATLDGEDYAGVTARLPMTQTNPVAFAVLGNRTQQVAMLSVVDVILILTILGCALVIAYGFVIANTIMGPIEEIEEGVLAVINGNSDTRLQVKSPELGGLAFRINQLMNVLTGTVEETEDEDGRVSVPPSDANWKDAAFADASAASGGGGAGTAVATRPAADAAASADEPIEDAALSAKLAAEDAAGYEKRVYQEYVAAKQAVGENVSNIPQDRFHQRLGARGSALAQKHGCRLVRFQVETRGDQVLLRPVLIR